jgi:hypothetical protein
VARPRSQLQDSLAEILAVGNEFAAAAERALVGSLSSAAERFVARHAEFFNAIDDETTRALRRSVDDTIRSSAVAIAHELRDPDLWLNPSVFPAPVVDEEEDWWGQNPFVLRMARIATRITDPADEMRLGNPFNRVWIHLSNGADRLDGVLLEFGFRPSAYSDWGGGHYGLQPQTVDELDPSGRLVRLWERYAKLYRQYRVLEHRLGDAAAHQARKPAAAGAMRLRRDGPTK